MSPRIGTTLGVLLASAVLCSAGCERDRPAAAHAESQAGASRPIAPPTAPTRRTSWPLQSWSPQTQALFGIDVVQFRESPLRNIVDGWLHSVVSGCGDDLVKQVDRVLVVTRDPGDDPPIYVFSGPTRSSLTRCEGHAHVWLDDSTLAMSSGVESAALEAATSTRQRTNARLLAAVSRVDTGAALWVAAANPPGEPGWSEDFDEMRGTVVVRNGLKATFELDFKTSDKAASAATAFDNTVKQMPPLSQYFEVARATADGSWVRTELAMSREQLARFPSDPMFSGLFPAPPSRLER